MVGIGVPSIIFSENAAMLGLTFTFEKGGARRIGRISERVALRPRSMSFGAVRAARRTASSAGLFRISPSGDLATPSAAEEINAAPTMRLPEGRGDGGGGRQD